MSDYPARASDPHTSHESAHQIDELVEKLHAHILVLVKRAGPLGLTINEAERAITEHKNHSVSPRFSTLVEKGLLARKIIGFSARGRPRYQKRYDPNTRRNVIVHWLPEFLPKEEKESDHQTQMFQPQEV